MMLRLMLRLWLKGWSRNRSYSLTWRMLEESLVWWRSKVRSEHSEFEVSGKHQDDNVYRAGGHADVKAHRGQDSGSKLGVMKIVIGTVEMDAEEERERI